MSKPTRYTTKLLQSDKTGRLEICPCYEGEWVAYSDYAALAAENERLRSKLSFSQSISEICNQPHEGETIIVKGAISSGKTDLSSLCQCDRLAAENERLRKVGFRLAERLSWCGNLGDNPLIEEWQQITGTDVYKDDEGGAK